MVLSRDDEVQRLQSRKLVRLRDEPVFERPPLSTNSSIAASPTACVATRQLTIQFLTTSVNAACFMN
jgi:hypothetical protein